VSSKLQCTNHHGLISKIVLKNTLEATYVSYGNPIRLEILTTPRIINVGDPIVKHNTIETTKSTKLTE